MRPQAIVLALGLCNCGAPAEELVCGDNATKSRDACECIGNSIPSGDDVSCDPCPTGQVVSDGGDACQWSFGLKDPCTDDASCPLGHCEQGLVEKFCTYGCEDDADCPAGWGCNGNGVCGLPDDFRSTCDPNQPDSNADCMDDNSLCVVQTSQCNPLAFPGFASMCQGFDQVLCPADTVCAQEGTELFFCAEPLRIDSVQPLTGDTTGSQPTITWADPVQAGIPPNSSILVLVALPTIAGIPTVFGIVPPTVTSVTIGSYPAEWIDLSEAYTGGLTQSATALPPDAYVWAIRARSCPFSLTDGGAGTTDCVIGFFAAPSAWRGGLQFFTVE